MGVSPTQNIPLTALGRHKECERPHSNIFRLPGRPQGGSQSGVGLTSWWGHLRVGRQKWREFSRGRFYQRDAPTIRHWTGNIQHILLVMRLAGFRAGCHWPSLVWCSSLISPDTPHPQNTYQAPPQHADSIATVETEAHSCRP